MFNRIVTQGLGPKNPEVLVVQSSGLVTRGYGPKRSQIPSAIVEEGRPLRLRLGQSGTKRRLAETDTVVVWASLMSANGVVPSTPVKGWIRVNVNRSSVGVGARIRHLSTRPRDVLEMVTITVRRL